MQDDASTGAVEYAYSLMAKAAGIAMPETHLFGTGADRYFGVRRFDRDGDRRIHMHSLAGLLHADHRASALDYDTLLTATVRLTRDVSELARAFRLACFNVLAHNRDDHAKNFSFLLNDATGDWTFSPAYDLTFSAGPGGEQSMLVMGEGRAPGIPQLQALAKKHGVKDAPAIIEAVRAAVADWPRHADAAQVSKAAAARIGQRIAPARRRPARANVPAGRRPIGRGRGA
jgi:serine/threonine-protein kinase HipA